MDKDKKDKEIIKYEDSQCLICGRAYIRCILISLRIKQFILCTHCEKDLKETLTGVKDHD